jgi:CheY-like chemotaxis protein
MDGRRDLILVIDDDADDQYIIGELLREAGLSDFVVRNNGEEALKYLDRKIDDAQLPHLILLDLSMPILGGKLLLKLLKSNNRYASIPIIIYSGGTDHNEIIECLKLGATSYVIKPTTVENMHDLIHEVEKILFSQAKNNAEQIDLELKF